MGRPRTVRCPLPDLLRLFLEQDLDAPGSIYSWAWFVNFETHRRVSQFAAGAFLLPSELRERASQGLRLDTTYVALWHMLSIGALGALYQLCDDARKEVAINGMWAEIREPLLPRFRQLARKMKRKIGREDRWANPLMCAWHAGAAPDPADLLPDGDATRVALRAAWEALPLDLRHGVPAPDAAVRCAEVPWRSAADLHLAAPYDQVFARVCAAALVWLGDLDTFRCQGCGNPILLEEPSLYDGHARLPSPPEPIRTELDRERARSKRIDTRYCSPECKQSAYRARKRANKS